MSASETNISASASTSVTATGNESLTLADEIKKYNTEALIEFLRKEEDLGLDDDDLEIIRKQKVNGRAFLTTSKEEFQGLGLQKILQTSLRSVKLRSFSSY
jgi:hypothetical protein